MSENIKCHDHEEARRNFKRQNAKDRCLILTRATDGENRLEMTTPCIGRMFGWCIKDDISASRKKVPNTPSFSYRRQTFNYKTKAGKNKGNEDTFFRLNIICSHLKCQWSQNLFGRAFKIMKNGVYFIVIAPLVAELFKNLIYAR